MATWKLSDSLYSKQLLASSRRVIAYAHMVKKNKDNIFLALKHHALKTYGEVDTYIHTFFVSLVYGEIW
jgi:hypothetical protein